MQYRKLAIAALTTIALSVYASGVFAEEGRPAGGGGGGDIIVWDIVDSAVESSASRPAGGGGVGGDIIIWDIVDSVTSSR